MRNSCASLVLLLTLTACATDAQRQATSPGAVPQKPICPISGEPVEHERFVAYFQVYPVYCATAADAAQFGALPLTKRARVAASQVLPQKGISNETCPLTGQDLTAGASPVTFQGEVIGFASMADANQFRSLRPEQQDALIIKWRATERAALETANSGAAAGGL